MFKPPGFSICFSSLALCLLFLNSNTYQSGFTPPWNVRTVIWDRAEPCTPLHVFVRRKTMLLRHSLLVPALYEAQKAFFRAHAHCNLAPFLQSRRHSEINYIHNFVGLHGVVACTGVYVHKPEMGATVHSPQFHINVTVTLNCTLWSRLLVLMEKLPVPHEKQLNAQFYCTIVLLNLQLRYAATRWHDLRFLQ